MLLTSGSFFRRLKSRRQAPGISGMALIAAITPATRPPISIPVIILDWMRIAEMFVVVDEYGNSKFVFGAGLYVD
jgi:hypothetical protein